MNIHYAELFQPRFQVEKGPGLPTTEKVVHFSTSHKRNVVEGLVLRFVTTEEPHLSWIGNFEEGGGGCTGVFAGPGPFQAYVVVKGRGFAVDVRNPDDHEALSVYPVQHVRSVPELNLLVFADFTEVGAYGVHGLAWRTPRISWDGIEIIQATTDSIRGRGWNAVSEEWVEFVVDPRTGITRGGAAPPEH